MRREFRERFTATDFKGNRQLTIPACIMARASRTRHDACRDRGGEKVPHPRRMRNPQFYVSDKRPILRPLNAQDLLTRPQVWQPYHEK